VGTTEAARGMGGAETVHPHARGDNRFCASLIGPSSGSPPRAWGQLNPTSSRFVSQRFTPTRVGTTAFAAMVILPSSVHPHARGDNHIGNVQAAPHLGSPPRAWGQRIMMTGRTRPGRFTPTRVGTTRSWHA